MKKWWNNLEMAEIDFRPGGALQLRWHSWNGEVTGVYREIIKNKRIVFTWKPDPMEEGQGETTVTLDFEDRGNTTRLSLLHAFNRSTSEADSHKGGWSVALADLGLQHPRILSPVTVERNLAAPWQRFLPR